jgi:hypothetical protein
MGAWGSVAGTAGAAGTSTLLAGNLTGFSALHSQDVVSVSNLAGGLASSGIQYGMTGEATLNVLNLADLGSNSHYGLMEMHLGGDQGFGMNVGSNGTDMSVGTIGRAMAGMGTFVKQQQFNYYEAVGGVQYAADYTGSREVGTQLRENYSFGDQAAQVQLARFLSGQDNLRVGYIGNEGQTTAVGESRVVDLATLGQKGNIASQLAAGTVMQHEAHRNGVYDGVLGQEYETQRAALGHTEMALRVAKEYGTGLITSSENLTNDVLNYLQGPETFAKYVGSTYDSSADYWRLAKDSKGKYGWEWDNNLDFDVSLLVKEGNFAKAMMKNPDLAAAFILGGGTISYKNMNTMVASQLSSALTPFVQGNDTGGDFARGTITFANASDAAIALMMNPSGMSVYSLNAAMMRVQSSGLLVRGSATIDRTGLFGDGTDEVPYLPVRADDNGKVALTGYAGYRFVDDNLYNGLKRSQVNTGKQPESWLDQNFPLYGFADKRHSGGDLHGSGDVIAVVNGSYSLSYDSTFGFGSALTSAARGDTQYFQGHMSAESAMDYIAAFSTQGVTLAQSGSSYKLNGTIAGMVLGNEGDTGLAAGVHAHSEIRTYDTMQGWVADARLWNETFGYGEQYGSALVPTTWATRNSGYKKPDLSNPVLWKNLSDDWKQNGYDYMNMPRFFLKNSQNAPEGYRMNWDEFIYGIYKGRIGYGR